MRSPDDVIRRFVLDPIDELTNVRDVFAFGRPWESRLNELGLKQIDKLGKNKAQLDLARRWNRERLLSANGLAAVEKAML